MKTIIKKLMSTGLLSVATTLLLIGCGGQTEEEIFEKILTKHLSDKGYVLSTYVTFPYTTRDTDYGWRRSVNKLNPFVEAGLLELEKTRRKVREGLSTRLQESFIYSLTPLGEKSFVERPDTVGFRVADIKFTSIKKIYNDVELSPDSEEGKNNRNVVCAATLKNLAPCSTAASTVSFTVLLSSSKIMLLSLFLIFMVTPPSRGRRSSPYRPACSSPALP